MAKPKIEKEVVSFRLKSNYLKTFRKACEVSGVRMSSIIESLMFRYLKELDQIMKEEEEMMSITERLKRRVSADLKEFDEELMREGYSE